MLATGLLALWAGGNWLLQKDGGSQIESLARQYLPGAEVQYGEARIGLGLDGAVVRAYDLRIGDGDGVSVHAPRADIWLDIGGRAGVFLHEPLIRIRRSSGVPPLPLAGDWGLAARDASIELLDAATGISIALRNTEFKASYRSGELLFNAMAEEDDGRMLAAARLDVSEALELAASDRGAGAKALARRVKGDIYAQTDYYPPPAGAPAWLRAAPPMRATMMAQIESGRISVDAAGGWDENGAVKWHVSGGGSPRNANFAMTLVATAASAGEEIPPGDAAAGGTLMLSGKNWSWRGAVAAVNDDGSAGGEVVLSGAGVKVESIDARLRAAGVRGESMWRYVSEPKVRAWLAESLTGGKIDQALIRVSGPPAVPIVGLTASFSGATILIAEGWPEARNLYGIFAMREDGAAIDGGGEIGEIPSDDIRARIPSNDDPATLHLNILMGRADAGDYLETARQIEPSREAAQEAIGRAAFRGSAKLSLTVQVPLATPRDAEFVSRLTLENLAVSIRPPPCSRCSGNETAPPSFTHARGVLNMGGSSVRGTLHGALMGGKALAVVDDGRIALRGEAPASEISRLLGLPSNLPVSGRATFDMLDADGVTEFFTDLRGLDMRLPAPLAKPAGEAMTVSARIEESGMAAVFHTEGGPLRASFKEGGADIAINVDSLPPPAAGMFLHGWLDGAEDMDKWLEYASAPGGDSAVSLLLLNSRLFGVDHEYLFVNAPPAMPDGGRRIMLAGDAADGEIILRSEGMHARMRRLTIPAFSEIGGGAGMLAPLSLSLGVHTLHIGGEDMGALTLQSIDGGWLAGGDVADGVLLTSGGIIRGDLNHVALPGLKAGGGVDLQDWDVSLAIKTFIIGGATLGDVSLEGTPGPRPGGGWKLDSLLVKNGRNAMIATGQYDGIGMRTSLTLLLDVPDAPGFLSIFGQNGLISEGSAKIEGEVFWPGAPARFDLETLGGQMSLNAEDIRYLEAEQNALSLLSILSPQSLLQLGFTELGREGVRIDSMRGNILLADGFAKLQDIDMENADLIMNMGGEIDMADGVLDINGRVRPGNRLVRAGSSAVIIGSVATVTSAMLAAGWFLGKLFEQPLSNIGAYNYTITGTWDDPVYTEKEIEFSSPPSSNQ